MGKGKIDVESDDVDWCYIRTPVDSTFSSHGVLTIQIFENVDMIQIFASVHLLLRVDHPRYLSALRKDMFSNHVLTPYPVLNPITMQVCIGVHGKNVYTHGQRRNKSNNAAIRHVFLQIFENLLNQHFDTLGDLNSYVCVVVCLNRGGVSSSKLVLWCRTRCQGCVDVCVDADIVYQ